MAGDDIGTSHPCRRPSGLSDYPRFADLSLPDQLRLAAFEAEDRLPLPMLDAIQRAADLLEEVEWAAPPAHVR
jgi:hypothetical protein